jgi:hypothetical protein
MKCFETRFLRVSDDIYERNNDMLSHRLGFTPECFHNVGFHDPGWLASYTILKKG